MVLGQENPRQFISIHFMGKPQLSKDNFGQSEKKDAYSLKNKQIDNRVPNTKSRIQIKSEIIPSVF